MYRFRFLLALISAFHPSSVLATSKNFWPTDFIVRNPTQIIFGPERYSSFVATSGIESRLFEHKKTTQFTYLSFGSEWENPRGCTEEARKRGYIHTNSVVAEDDGPVRIAFPVLFEMVFRGDAKQVSRVLNWPVLKLSVLKTKVTGNVAVNEAGPAIEELEPLFAQMFYVKDFVNPDWNMGPTGGREVRARGRTEGMPESTTDEVITINSKSIAISQPFTLVHPTDYRVRLEWSSDGICGEEGFNFKIANQIRVVVSY